MRFMIMHKHDANTEAGLPPSRELVDEMGKFIGGYAAAGKLVDGAGLGASKTRTRLSFRKGQYTAQRGPYRGERELPAAALVLEVRTHEEALGWAERYGKILGDGEIELGKVNEPWDIGVAPMPDNPPLHVLLIEKADRASEADARSREQQAALAQLEREMSAAGVLLRSIRLQPSARAKRLQFEKNDLRVLDGPFAESKELLGGFALLDLADMDEAIALCRQYARILGGTVEIDIRPTVS
jgi:hypothetical protein